MTYERERQADDLREAEFKAKHARRAAACAPNRTRRDDELTRAAEIERLARVVANKVRDTE